MDADSHGDEAQAGLSQLVDGKRILAGGEDLLEVAVRRGCNQVQTDRQTIARHTKIARQQL